MPGVKALVKSAYIRANAIIHKKSKPFEIHSGPPQTYNWQQGCRAQWIDNDRVIFNVLRNGGYRAAILSVRDGKITDEFPLPVQDA